MAKGTKTKAESNILSVEVSKAPVEVKPTKADTKSVKIPPQHVLYVRVDANGEEVEPQIVHLNTWNKFLSKNQNFRLKKSN